MERTNFSRFSDYVVHAERRQKLMKKSRKEEKDAEIVIQNWNIILAFLFIILEKRKNQLFVFDSSQQESCLSLHWTFWTTELKKKKSLGPSSFLQLKKHGINLNNDGIPSFKFSD